MRTEFVEVKSRAMVRKRCPWAAKIIKVEGGFKAFESIADYKQWKNQ